MAGKNGGFDVGNLVEMGAKAAVGIVAPEAIPYIAAESAVENTAKGGSPVGSLLSVATGGMDGGLLGDAAGTLTDAGAQAFMDSGSLPQGFTSGLGSLGDDSYISGGGYGTTTGSDGITYTTDEGDSGGPPSTSQQLTDEGVSGGSPSTSQQLTDSFNNGQPTPAEQTPSKLTQNVKQASQQAGQNEDNLKGLWNSLGKWGQLGVLGAGGLGAYALLSQDNKKYGTPPTQNYSGPLSKFSYNPNTFTPISATPNVYRPTYAASGGLMNAKRYAEGGPIVPSVNGNVSNPVEQMSRENALGSNQLFPQASVPRQSFANAINTPMSNNIVNSVSDASVDPYTGAQRMASGGIANAKTNNMEAIDNYIAQAQQEGGMQQVMAKARGGDYNAMLALNKLNNTPNQNYAQGGSIGHLGSYSDGGRLLKGPGDGMSDNIPATIGHKQPARLADNEFVVPADVVSHLGNGSSDAGAKKLYKMMDNVRKARTGKKKQAPEIKADKYLPK